MLQQTELIRSGFEFGFKDEGKYYIYNHLAFVILVHPTHGEYMRARQAYKDAAVIDNIDAKRHLMSASEIKDLTHRLNRKLTGDDKSKSKAEEKTGIDLSP